MNILDELMPLGSVKLTNVKNDTNISLGKGWSYRYEVGDVNMPGNNDHIHLFKTNGSQEYSQNDNGSPKGGPKGGSGPSKKAKKLLKEKTGWDWDAKEQEWLNKIEINGSELGDYVIVYPDGTEMNTRFFPFSMLAILPTDEVIIKMYAEGGTGGQSTSGDIDVYFTPSLMPVPVLQFSPVPSFVSIFGF
ncbi:hypothetical protein QE109_05255 [Fusibacter bizertensis]|uniref:Uncharacterized protein n=1 Tax=Fusibacter bizertensis TaxID=1488331 RepID=A0ABT6NAU6_9FIRM|nr:hypothetical protein [Fusibacter bizertensis]MDH8677542.1 hypothetical protein [Fusibacter bizertensis]